MKETTAIIAAILAIIGNVPYVLDVIKDKVKPQAYTWFIWSLVSATTFFGGLVKGAGIGALPIAVSEIFTIIIFFLSLRYGFKKTSKTDTGFLYAALVGIIFWIITKDPTISVIIAVSIDIIAFLPTLRKTWVYPATEVKLLYATNVMRHILILCSIEAYNIATMLHSIAMIITNSLMVLFLIFHSIGKRYRE